jgi:hypothetical protein
MMVGVGASCSLPFISRQFAGIIDTMIACGIEIGDALAGNLFVTATDFGVFQILQLPPCLEKSCSHDTNGTDRGAYKPG